MKAVFSELPAFERVRSDYFDDAGFLQLQMTLMGDPRAGDVIADTGGLRKLRYPDPRRGKGTREGLRVIYYYWMDGPQFWLFTVYGKDEADDLTAEQRAAAKERLRHEIKARKNAAKARPVRRTH
jgi:hypothetical protein